MSWILGGAAVLLLIAIAAAAVLAYPRADKAETPTVAASPSPSPFGPTWKVAADADVRANDVKFDRQYGDLYATANTDGTVTLFKVGRKARLARFDSTMGGATTGPQDLKSLDFSRDGKRLVTGGSRGSVEIWNLDTGKLVVKPFGAGRMGTINGVSFAPDRQSVATASADGTVRIWDASDGEQIGDPITTAPEGSSFKTAATAVQFSPNGQMLATLSDDGSVAFFDVDSHERIRQADAPSTTVGTVGDDLVYRPDGRVIATVSASGLHMWDARTGKSLKTPKTDSIGALAFRPDGKMLAIGSIAGPVRLYDPQKLTSIGNPPPGEFRFVDAMAFSPTGKYLAAAETDGKVRVWST